MQRPQSKLVLSSGRSWAPALPAGTQPPVSGAEATGGNELFDLMMDDDPLHQDAVDMLARSTHDRALDASTRPTIAVLCILHAHSLQPCHMLYLWHARDEAELAQDVATLDSIPPPPPAVAADGALLSRALGDAIDRCEAANVITVDGSTGSPVRAACGGGAGGADRAGCATEDRLIFAST